MRALATATPASFAASPRRRSACGRGAEAQREGERLRPLRQARAPVVVDEVDRLEQLPGAGHERVAHVAAGTASATTSETSCVAAGIAEIGVKSIAAGAPRSARRRRSPPPRRVRARPRRNRAAARPTDADDGLDPDANLRRTASGGTRPGRPPGGSAPRRRRPQPIRDGGIHRVAASPRAPPPAGPLRRPVAREHDGDVGGLRGQVLLDAA